MSNYLLLRGGRILDGKGETAAAELDVLIERERIARIAPAIQAPDARVLDADGLTVTPGFIDAHSHSDSTAFLDPSAQGRLYDGVTTEINGTCGLSLFPLTDAKRVSLKEQSIDADWADAAGYFDRLESVGSAINRGFLAGHGAIRSAVMGFEARPAGSQELARMERLVDESLEQGALGLSSGLCYSPGCFAETGELVALCRRLAAYGRPYCTHVRSEGRKLLESVAEALAVSSRGGVPLHISHVKVRGRENWTKMDDLERVLFEARENGMDLTADRYPYTAAMTDLSTLFPERLLAGGRDAALDRLRDPASRAEFERELENGRPEGIRWDEIRIAQTTEKEFEGLTMAEVAERIGVEPLAAVSELLLRARMRVTAIFFDMSEANLERILRWPFTMIGSDSSARALHGPTVRGKVHPRTFGTCSRFLGKYVRERQLLELPEAVARLTSRPAVRFGLKDRGVLREGAYADIAVFDAERIHDVATYESPYNLSIGVRHLIVNGQAVLADGKQTTARPGKVLRGG